MLPVPKLETPAGETRAVVVGHLLLLLGPVSLANPGTTAARKRKREVIGGGISARLQQ